MVLSSGFQPSAGFADLARRVGLSTPFYGFLRTAFDDPLATSRPGVYVCGGIEAPKDIPETVIQAGAAAADAAALLADTRDTETVAEKTYQENPIEDQPRIGVFVCHCGSNIAGVVNIDRVKEQVQALPHVVLVTDFVFSCSAETQPVLMEKIRKHRLNRIVVAACSPKTHEPLFQNTLRQAGLNPYLVEMANIRNHCSWVHGRQPEIATGKAVSLVRAAIGRAVHLQPLQAGTYPVQSSGLVVGGGIAGMTAALTMADQGFDVLMVEQDRQLGGLRDS